MSNKNRIVYVPIIKYGVESFVKLGIRDFKNLVDTLGIDKVFVYQGEDNFRRSSTQMLFFNNGLMYVLDSEGYRTIEDFIEANERGFAGSNSKIEISNNQARSLYDGNYRTEEGKIFYFVKSLGYDNFSEYMKAFKDGFGNLANKTYQEALKLGCQTFDDYEEYQARNRINEKSRI